MAHYTIEESFLKEYTSNQEAANIVFMLLNFIAIRTNNPVIFALSLIAYLLARIRAEFVNMADHVNGYIISEMNSKQNEGRYISTYFMDSTHRVSKGPSYSFYLSTLGKFASAIYTIGHFLRF